MLASLIALIKLEMEPIRFYNAIKFSIYRYFVEGYLRWEEWPPPSKYEGALPPIKKKHIELLLREGKLNYDMIEMDITDFLPNYKYQSRKEFLSVINDPRLNSEKHYNKTYLYRNKGNNKCLDVIKLFNSISKEGYKRFNLNEYKYFNDIPPCYIEMPDVGIRVDGTNRASILKFLGHKKIRVLRIKPDDLFGIKLPGDGRDASGNMRMNIIKHWILPYTKMNEIKVRISKNIFSSNWYQDVELAPGVYTHSKKPEQTNLWIKNVPKLTGRKMIDLGTNCGNYAFSAIDKGAKKVLGLEISKRDFDRAKFAQCIKSKNTNVYNNIIFKRLNILDNLYLLDGHDTFCASNVLYLLGPRVHDLFKDIEKSNIDLLILQGQLKRKNRIGEYNAPGVKGYEKTDKTWGNILGTIEGLTNIAENYGFKIENIIKSKNWPLIIAKR